ncbi:TPA: hypothetical protein DEP21_03840 [Patescibacteria group bacterium]|nr:hypothetical protein [Candidatus Gracilibacteria bacterium]
MIQKIIDQSDLILFVVDDTAGITAKEQQISEYITKQQKKSQTILIINKLDKKRKESQTDLALSDYYHMGFDDMVGISAKTKRNVADLKDLIIKKNYFLTQKQEEESDSPVFQNMTGENKGIPIAILGKPNAGKSTLLNKLVGQNLSKVENVAGTTRDYVVGSFTIAKKLYTIYDTAGIRKK